FDGDQMSVHLPLFAPARAEAADLLLASRNVLDPGSGEPIVVPTQDMVLGLHVMTREPRPSPRRPRAYASVDEVRLARDAGAAAIDDGILVRVPAAWLGDRRRGEVTVTTTVGRVLFNAELPLGETPGNPDAEPLRFLDVCIDAAAVAAIVGRCHALL